MVLKSMEEEKEKLNREREVVIQQIQQLDQQRNQLVIRLAEIQGVLKYLQDKNKEKKVVSDKINN